MDISKGKKGHKSLSEAFSLRSLREEKKKQIKLKEVDQKKEQGEKTWR